MGHAALPLKAAQDGPIHVVELRLFRTNSHFNLGLSEKFSEIFRKFRDKDQNNLCQKGAS